MPVKAENGIISGFTGIDSPYEEPGQPELILDTQTFSLNDCIHEVEQFMLHRRLIIRPDGREPR